MSMPILEDWAIITDHDPLLAPELRKMRLSGKVFNRQGFEDGTEVVTSSVQMIDLKNNIVKTKNTEYKLGKPSEEYLKWLEKNGKTLEDYFN